jgi:condensin complex subunit 3
MSSYRTYFPSDVRRAALLNLPLTAATLLAILSRTRDTDPLLRKLVYSAVMEPQTHISENDTAVGPAHPRALTIDQRELIVRNGLGDREGTVRAAAARMLGAWVDVARDAGSSSVAKKEEDKGAGGEVENDVIAFLKMFDLVEGAIAEDALLSVLTTRVDVFDALEFGGE